MADHELATRHLSRKEAIKQGNAFYWGRAPCALGHNSPRYLSSFGCVECSRLSWQAARAQKRQHTAELRAKRIAASPSPEKVISRQQAIANGLRRYYTGQACLRGHVAERLVSDKTCTVCDAARKVGNPAAQARHKAYYRINRARILDQTKTYQATNAASIRLRRKMHREANKERINARIAEWAQANPKKRRAKERNRESRERGAEGSHSYAEMMSLGERQRWRCANPACRVSISKAWHEDHVLPIALGGSNWIANIQLLCAPCNQAKGCKHPLEWAQLNGLLL